MRGAIVFAVLVLFAALCAIVTLALSPDPFARESARRMLGATLVAVLAIGALVGLALGLAGGL